jgi:hypothetical protein
MSSDVKHCVGDIRIISVYGIRSHSQCNREGQAQSILNTFCFRVHCVGTQLQVQRVRHGTEIDEDAE